MSMGQATPGLRSVVSACGHTGLRLVGGGVEFVVSEAVAPDGDRVVLRVPAGERFQSNANDPSVDIRSLLRWEHAVTRHVAAFGIPIDFLA